MPHRRQQQVVEIADDVRSNRFLLVQPRERGQRLLVGRHGEVVAPKVHEPLDERPVRGDREPVPLGRLLDVVLADERAELADRLLVDAGAAGAGRLLGRGAQVRADLRGDLPRDAQLADLGQHAGGLGLAGCRGGSGGFELRRQPALWVRPNSRRIAWPGAEPEAIGGDGRVLFNIDDPRLVDLYRWQRPRPRSVYLGGNF